MNPHTSKKCIQIDIEINGNSHCDIIVLINSYCDDCNGKCNSECLHSVFLAEAPATIETVSAFINPLRFVYLTHLNTHYIAYKYKGISELLAPIYSIPPAVMLQTFRFNASKSRNTYTPPPQKAVLENDVKAINYLDVDICGRKCHYG